MASKIATGISSHSPLHILRKIFRLLKTPLLTPRLYQKAATTSGLPSKSRSNSGTIYLMLQYRAHFQAKDSTFVSKQRNRAILFWQLRRSLAERAQLYTLDRGAEELLSPREMSRRAAARAGLQMPNEHLHVD